MAIRPIDMQITLPQVANVGQIQAVQNEQASTAQQLFAEKLMKEAEQKQGQVQETKKSDFGLVKRQREKEKEERKKKKNAYKASQQREEIENKAEKPHTKDKRWSLNPLLGKNLDISS